MSVDVGARGITEKKTTPAVASASGVNAADHERMDIPRARRASDRTLRVSAENLNRLLSLAGESLVESRWAKPFAASLLRLKRLHHELGLTLEGLHDVASERALD